MNNDRAFSSWVFVLALALFCLSPRVHAADPHCGDGVTDTGEECDDGNTNNRDGCSAYCKLEDMTPPTVITVSIADGTKGIDTATHVITVEFSEPIDPASVNTYNVVLESGNKPLDISVDMTSPKMLTIDLNQDLVSSARHAIHLKNIKDAVGNVMKAEFISVFDTAVAIDRMAPVIAVIPPAGTYNIGQAVTLTPYNGTNTTSEEYIDHDAKIYYTLDGTAPTKDSALYTRPLNIKLSTTLKFFGIDKIGNRSSVFEQKYVFTCPDFLNTVKVMPYPSCAVIECSYGYVLRGGVCVANMGGNDPNDLNINAVNAPLFSSEKALTISSKPAIRMTYENKGLIHRPIVFKDLKRGTIVRFERETGITGADGKGYVGYIKPPINLYQKDFPINFGYTFKSIFRFGPDDGSVLTFYPAYRITLPYTDAYNPDEPVTVFTYDKKKDQYSAFDPAMVSFDQKLKQVTIIANKSDTFFVAQKGEDFNRQIFQDTANHWARNYIEALYRKGLVKGKDDGIFAPDEPVTRAEFMKVALGAVKAKIPAAEAVLKAPFTDVPIDSWYAPYILTAQQLKLTNGFSDGSFHPDAPITRAEAIKILLTAFKIDWSVYGPTSATAAGTEKQFPDLNDKEWYFPVVDLAVQNGLLDGRRQGQTILDVFRPNLPLTRGEMAKLTVKTMDFSEALKAKKKKK